MNKLSTLLITGVMGAFGVVNHANAQSNDRNAYKTYMPQLKKALYSVGLINDTTMKRNIWGSKDITSYQTDMTLLGYKVTNVQGVVLDGDLENPAARGDTVLKITSQKANKDAEYEVVDYLVHPKNSNYAEYAKADISVSEINFYKNKNEFITIHSEKNDAFKNTSDVSRFKSTIRTNIQNQIDEEGLSENDRIALIKKLSINAGDVVIEYRAKMEAAKAANEYIVVGESNNRYAKDLGVNP